VTAVSAVAVALDGVLCDTSALWLDWLEAAGWEIGVFTDAPEPLARTALSHLGLERRITGLETGFSARERLLKRLASGAIVVESRAELLALAP